MTTPTTVNVRIQLRADTAANWTAANPILLANEAGFETDTKQYKLGDGTTAWNSLAYFPSLVSGGTVLGNLEIGSTGTLTFEGATVDDYETTLGVIDPTADRVINLPDQSGTVIVTGNASIVDADIAANAEIAVSKLANGTANQVLVTDGTDVSWSDNLTLAGDLTVNGTTTTVNSETLLVKDKNIEMGVVDTPTDSTADGGGITLKGATDKTINWIDATDSWTSSENIDLASGKSYRINDAEVLSATTLGSGVTGSSLTGVGTISTGTWQGTAIDAAYLDSTVVTTGDTGTVTSTMMANGTIVDADVNASAAIAGTKISPDFGSQNVVTTGNATAAALIPSGSTVPSNGVYLPAANTVGVANNGSERARIDSSGRLLVGTSTSTTGTSSQFAKLQVIGNNSASADRGAIVNLGHSAASASVTTNELIGQIIFTDNAAGEYGFIGCYADGTAGSGDYPGRLVFSTTADGASSPTERARITSKGYFQNSTTGSYSTTNYSVFQTDTTDWYALGLFNSAASPYGLAVRFTGASPNNATNQFIYCRDSTANRFIVMANGGVHNYSANNVNLSDIKTKKDISTVESTWECIKQWELVNYRYKEQEPDSELTVGVIAQQIQQSCPEVVTVFQEAKDATEEEPAQEELLGVKEQHMIWMAIKSLQEAQIRIEALESEVAALKAP